MRERRDDPLGEPSGRGAHILRPRAPAPPPTRRERIARFLRRFRVPIATGLAVLVTAVGALDATLNLWGRTGDSDGPGNRVVVGHQTVEPGRITRALWDRSQTGCDPGLPGFGPFLVDTPRPGEDAPGPRDVGAGYDHYAKLTTAPWVHPEIIDVDPEAFTREAFRAAGAYAVGEQELRVLLANRTSEQLVITDVTLDVERRPPPAGTLVFEPGGDPLGINVISFDLAEPEPVARAVGDDCTPAGPFFEEYAVTVDPAATEVFTVALLPGACLCLVRLAIEYWHQGRWQTLTVPQPGADPIPVTAGITTGRYGMVYVDNTFIAQSDPSYDGEVVEKHDCLREDHHLCEPAARPPD